MQHFKEEQEIEYRINTFKKIKYNQISNILYIDRCRYPNKVYYAWKNISLTDGFLKLTGMIEKVCLFISDRILSEIDYKQFINDEFLNRNFIKRVSTNDYDKLAIYYSTQYIEDRNECLSFLKEDLYDAVSLNYNLESFFVG